MIKRQVFIYLFWQVGRQVGRCFQLSYQLLISWLQILTLFQLDKWIFIFQKQIGGRGSDYENIWFCCYLFIQLVSQYIFQISQYINYICVCFLSFLLWQFKIVSFFMDGWKKGRKEFL
ncbi:transmembrane protein, putative (macronuclear) [Tetrahymena thermophila SB210]|uniref:Transmembrane protein, putative n=1 Tax=Tetrahymena thermophila (strain SB210) TaxID=312017 RepID=A4VDT3_TETTS|nr:transmembrane protein, putative [Tetrahymena thermophila SB210]EDK31692.1 transmembrane protein, putative [Tetrahymena thermophila SB210]|eukprot:XP_001470820.1 transmembrane protein, putative [Tetrahymena thermophila SB210]